MRWSLLLVASPVCLYSLSGAVLTFEGLSDLQPVGTYYSGVTFTNAVASIAGFSLNEAEVPPFSGVTVILDDTSPMKVAFSSPISSLGARFTYTGNLQLSFFLGGSPVGNTTSLFANNLALSGDPGSAPNELITYQRTGGFDSVVIDSPGAYAVDDVSYERVVSGEVPEPGFAIPVGIVLIAGIAAHAYARRTGEHCANRLTR